MAHPTKNRVIILNAPKGSGKDTIGVCFRASFGCQLKAFKDSLYQCAFPFTKLDDYGEFLYYCNDRELKEEPSELFRGMSPRQFLIHVSEDIAKPMFGKQFFGEKSAESITDEQFERGVVFTDGGFEEEVQPLIKKFGKKSVIVVQFSGQGSYNFDGDSRGFIEPHGITTIKMRQKNEDILPVKFMQLIAQEVIKYGN